ncbi:GGDEF domain [Anaerobutyricum hallii]|uniref:GGDEF domain n=1 Tax=Anaerobutyricum hallii TaxID=39488 RepID=A0A285PQS9_9FIRM|nr:GGDEF domain-containing phosphodiesterase [Anaerobutyricum hallii]SOB71968.1 GGDEF domain [Anaerobutyricum hallii]
MTDIAKIRTGKVKGTMNSNNLSDYYYNHSFMERLRKRLPEILPNTYCIVAIDIEHFRLFNKLYGRSSGDEVIRYIYTCLKQSALEYDGIDAYLGGDNFVAFLPDDDEVLNNIRQKIIKKFSKWNNTSAFFPLFGVYTIEDTSVLPELMYDHAMLALSHAEEDYKWHICRYTMEMESCLEEEVYLLAAIEEGLQKEEFTFFAQPQCNIATGQIVGAEALVRWQKPDGEVLLPGGFIPVLEKNKMIDRLDRYVWEKVCQWLRGWIDQGYSPVPISINVSRIDIFEMDVPKYIFSLLEKYQIPEYLIKIEITESAYTENNNRISHAVNTLRNRGLVVMMDDFGCGYSSLNMLKNIPVDVLKLDMRFLQFKEEERQKSANILEAIVNMAGLLHLPIVVEGVENESQEKFVQKLGCRYIQGFYYYKPLPIKKFEELLRDKRQIDTQGLVYKQVEPMHIREFIDTNFVSDSMLNNVLGPVVFFEVFGGDIKVTRVNEQYFRMIGEQHFEEDIQREFLKRIPEEERCVFHRMIEKAFENPVLGADGMIHLLREGEQKMSVYTKVFYLREREGYRQYYCSLMDISRVI